MMEDCGICFKVRQISAVEREYIAPELLPTWSYAQELLLGRLRDDPPTARYAFLHEGILRGYLPKLGEHGKDAAISGSTAAGSDAGYDGLIIERG
jgi:hypothetical protein